jgi:type IVB pilus formation R64 PilN family outer membrane protein
MRYKPNFLLATTVSAALVAAGCTSAPMQDSISRAQREVPKAALPVNLPATEATRGTSASLEARSAERRDAPVVRRASAPWIGGSMVPSTNEDALPGVFANQFSLDFGTGRVSLAVMAARLTKITGVPVRIRPDVYQSSRSAAVASQPLQAVAASSAGATRPAGPLPVSMPLNAGPTVPAGAVSSEASISVDSIGMTWSGTLRDFLDHMTSTLSLAWEYRDGAIVIMRMVTETYEVAAFPGQQKFGTNLAGTGSGTSGQTGQTQSSNASMNVSQSGEMDARKSILESIKAMVASVPNSNVATNEGTGRLVVTTSKEMQAQVRDYIRLENKMLRQMVNVTFDVYSVRTTDTNTSGIDWSAIYQSLAGGYGLTVKSPASLADTTAGAIGATVLSGRFTNSTAMLTLLRQYGDSVQHRPVTITTLNGQWDTKTRLSTDGYLKETVPGVASSSGAAGAPGLKTDTVTTGDQFAVLPQVMQDNSVMVKYMISLSDLLGLFDVSTGSGATLQKVQTPRIDSVNANSTILLGGGETAMITGLSRLISSSDENRLTENAPLALGGSRKLSVQREHFIVLVRATPI